MGDTHLTPDHCSSVDSPPMNDAGGGGGAKLKKPRKNGAAGLAASFLSGTDGSSAASSRGRSIKLPTFINYNSMAHSSSNGYSYNDDHDDDKHLKYTHRVKKRVITYANSPSTGAVGAVLRSAIRGGVLERTFWKRALALVALLLLAGLAFLWRSYETHIELAFYPRTWIRQTILPVPSLSSTCFAPTSPTMQAYNTSLADAPKGLLLNPGISMRLGMDSYSFASTLSSTPLEGQTLPEETIYHLYWRADLQALGPRQVALIKSILSTQDPQRSRVILWTNNADKLYQDPLLAEVREYATRHHVQSLIFGTDPTATVVPRFTVEAIDLEALARGTAMDAHPLLESAM